MIGLVDYIIFISVLCLIPTIGVYLVNRDVRNTRPTEDLRSL